MASVIQCDLCKSICSYNEAFHIKIYKRKTMDSIYGTDICPKCCDKILKELKQEADN